MRTTTSCSCSLAKADVLWGYGDDDSAMRGEKERGTAGAARLTDQMPLLGSHADGMRRVGAAVCPVVTTLHMAGIRSYTGTANDSGGETFERSALQ
jgi:hypothetical protein